MAEIDGGLHRRIRTQMRRQITQNGAAGGGYSTTVGAVAKSVGMSSMEVVVVLEDAWLVVMTKDGGPLENWMLEEDGE